MIVYVDGMDFRRTGIGRVMEGILSGLVDEEAVTGIQTVIPRSKASEFEAAFGGHPKIQAAFADFEPFSPGDFLFKRSLINRFSSRADVRIFPNMNVPLFPDGTFVCTINDIIMMTSDSSWGSVKKWLFRFLAGRAISRARGVICISDFTRREVERVFGKCPAPIRVIHPCIGEDFLHADAGKYRKDPIVEGKYILHVGIRVRHKNHEGLIRGWREAVKTCPGLRLAIAGKRLWEDDVDRLRKEFGLAGEMLEFKNATDEEVKNLYANAAAFVFPSLVEGFGIPPLEAMRMGVPVVCADIPVLREVNGNAALYVDPRSPSSIGKAIASVISDDSMRERLVSAGNERIRHYTRKRMAAEYVEFLREMSG